MGKRILRNSIFGISSLLLLGASIAVAAPGKPMSDQWIEGRVNGALSYNPYLDSSDLSVDVKDKQAVLTGTVSSETEKELAQLITLNIVGVSNVENKIKVDPEVAVRARPEWVQLITDATTTAAVKTRLLINKNVHDKEINVQTKNGVVALTGNVDSLLQKKSAEAIAYNTRDVYDVKNDLKITDPQTFREKASNASQDVASAVSDTWISSKIRTSLLFSSDLPGSNVTVSINEGTVTLDGYARSNAQREEIEKMVNDFVGVRRVENNLNVRNS